MRQNTTQIAGLLLLGGALAACDCGAPPTPDAGRPADAGCVGCDHWTGDHAAPDAGPDDSAPLDTGLEEGGEPDRPPQDAGPRDWGLPDLWAPEGGWTEPPQAPEVVEVYTGAAIRLVFSWAARAESYQTYLFDPVDSRETAVGLPVSANEVVVRGLVPGEQAVLVVRAHNQAGTGPPSQPVAVIPLDGVAHRRGVVSGRVTSADIPIAGAVVRLAPDLLRRALPGRAVTDVDGRFHFVAPTGLFAGIEAGFDQPPSDGDPFEIGQDATGFYRPPNADRYFMLLEVSESRPLENLTIEIAEQSTSCSVSGVVTVGAGWPLGPVVVEAHDIWTGQRIGATRADEHSSFSLQLPSMSVVISAFLDIDADGSRSVNEPAGCDEQVYHLGVPDCSVEGYYTSIGAAAALSGTLTGASGWAVEARHRVGGGAATYGVAAPDGVEFSLAVPEGRELLVRAFRDLDGNGRRSFYDANRDGWRDGPYEEWSEPGSGILPDVVAGSSGVDFALGPMVTISGRVTPAMVPWRIVAEDPSGGWMFVTTAAPDGSFRLEVTAAAEYYLYAYDDTDGDERRTLGHEPMILYGATIDARDGAVEGIEIVQRWVHGRIEGDRTDRSEGILERVLVQQLVGGVGGGPFCAPVELNSYVWPDAEGRFSVAVGAIGEGAGTLPWSECEPACTGIVVTRYLDRGGDYIYAEGCEPPEPVTYPATPAAPDTPALVLDTSAGDLFNVEF